MFYGEKNDPFFRGGVCSMFTALWRRSPGDTGSSANWADNTNTLHTLQTANRFARELSPVLSPQHGALPLEQRKCQEGMLASIAAVQGLVARPVDVAIIGGGPCGLSTALALSKARCLRGAAVEVFESDAFGPKGASIQISKYGWAALTATDAEAARRIKATGEPVTRISLRALGGGTLTPLPVRLFMAVVGVIFGLLRRFGVRQGLARTHLWHDVRTVLRERAAACGVALRPSKTLVQMTEEADVVRLRFDDGEEVAARVVLACDGASSTCRRLLPSEADDLLVDERKSVWRGQARST